MPTHTYPNGNGNGNGTAAAHVAVPSEWTPSLVLTYVLGIVASNDIRYREAFLAAKDAVSIASTGSEKLTAAAFTAAEKAIQLAEANAERWRQDAQEWRTRMTDREKDFATQAEYDALKERLDRNDGSS